MLTERSPSQRASTLGETLKPLETESGCEVAGLGCGLRGGTGAKGYEGLWVMNRPGIRWCRSLHDTVSTVKPTEPYSSKGRVLWYVNCI